MEQETFNELWNKIRNEADDRQPGSFSSFKRAFWYGGRNVVSKQLGDGKGFRKTLRNSPKTILTKILPAAAALPLAFIAPGANVAASSILSKLVKYSIVAAKALTKTLTRETINKAHKVHKKKVYRKFFKRTKESGTFEEKMRREIKHATKDLEKGEGLLVIDRNLVKLRDAKKEIDPALKELMAILEKGEMSAQEQKEVAYNTLRQIAETMYYLDKISELIAILRGSLSDDIIKPLTEMAVHMEQFKNDSVAPIIIKEVD